MYFHALDVHSIGLWWRNWGSTASPTLSPYGRTRIASIPETETDFDRSLGEFVACLSCSDGADIDAIDRPSERSRRPIKRIGVKLCGWAGHLDVLGNTIVRDAFAIVVRLDLTVV